MEQWNNGMMGTMGKELKNSFLFLLPSIAAFQYSTIPYEGYC